MKMRLADEREQKWRTFAVERKLKWRTLADEREGKTRLAIQREEKHAHPWQSRGAQKMLVTENSNENK